MKPTKPQQDGMPEKLAVLARNAVSFLRIKGVEALTEAGYRRAWGLSAGVVDRHINILHEQVRSGTSLSKQEQFLLTRLTEIKGEIDAELLAMSGKHDDDRKSTH